METKKGKFVRVAEARTNKIISMIRLLGNCSNKATYEYTNGDIKKIFGENVVIHDMESHFEEG